MLRHPGPSFDASTQIRNALEKGYAIPKNSPKIFGGQAGTSQFADAVIEEMEKAKTASVSQVSLFSLKFLQTSRPL